MRSSVDIWRERSWQWWLPLAFVVINLLAFGFYRANFAGGVAALQERYEAEEEVLVELRAQSDRIASILERAEQQSEQIRVLYDDRFATEAERFTAVLREVRQLARTAGLDPDSFNYPESTLDSYSLVRRDVVFSVTGTYEQLRTFVNLLELSDQFVTLERVSLQPNDTQRGNQLSIQLQISTYFRDSTGLEEHTS